jgi:nucleoside phosphorylase
MMEINGCFEKPESPCLFVFATDVEAEPFIRSLRMKRLAKDPISLFGGSGALLAVSGVGKSNAALTTAFCCVNFSPPTVLNLGCAGSVNRRFQRGNIFLVSRVIEPDRPHLRSCTPHEHVPALLPGFPEATLATQDRPVITREERQILASVTDLVDMEAAAVIQTARRFHSRSLVFKFVSDTGEEKNPTDIVPYVKEGGKIFCDFIIESVIPRVREIGAPVADK